MAWGTNSTLPALKTVTLKPGNSGLCGTLPSLGYSVQYSSGNVTYPITSSFGTCAREPEPHALDPVEPQHMRKQNDHQQPSWSQSRPP